MPPATTRLSPAHPAACHLPRARWQIAACRPPPEARHLTEVTIQLFMEDFLQGYQTKSANQRKIADRAKHSLDADRLENFPSVPQVHAAVKAAMEHLASIAAATAGRHDMTSKLKVAANNTVSRRTCQQEN